MKHKIAVYLRNWKARLISPQLLDWYFCCFQASSMLWCLRLEHGRRLMASHLHTMVSLFSPCLMSTPCWGMTGRKRNAAWGYVSKSLFLSLFYISNFIASYVQQFMTCFCILKLPSRIRNASMNSLPQNKKPYLDQSRAQHDHRAWRRRSVLELMAVRLVADYPWIVIMEATMASDQWAGMARETAGSQPLQTTLPLRKKMLLLPSFPEMIKYFLLHERYFRVTVASVLKYSSISGR